MNHTKCPFGDKYDKYWQLRYDLFSRFDEGIQIDLEGLYSAKPENISLELGKEIYGEVILDAFGGVGASAIGFARNGKKVICVEKNPLRFKILENNVRIYNLTDKITLINDDVLVVKDGLSFDSVYLDPPWGGPSYINKEYFTLENFEPDGNFLLESFNKANQVVLTVPLNFDYNEMAKLGKNYFLKWGVLNNRRIFANIFLENNKVYDINLF